MSLYRPARKIARVPSSLMSHTRKSSAASVVQPNTAKCPFAAALPIHDPDIAFPSMASDSAIKPFEEMPSPRGIYGIPYLGTALQQYPFTKYRTERFDERAEEWRREFGDICRVRLPSEWNVFVFDPCDVETTFRADSKYPFRRSLPLFDVYNNSRNRESTIGERNGKNWWELRSPAQKGIGRPKTLSKLLPKLSVVADDFVNNCRETGRLENLPYPFFEYASEGAGLLCFNKRLGIVSSPGSPVNREFMEFVDNYFDYFGEQLLAPIHWFKWFRTPGYRKFENASDILMSYTDKHTEIAVKNLKKTPDSNEFNLLHFLLTTPGMTPAKVSSLIVDVFRGGIDSTANAMTFMLYHLAKYPDIQEKLYEELAPRIPAEGPIGQDGFKDLHYLKACLKESFRFVYPVIMGTQRVLDRDVVLSNYAVPAGTTINLCITSMCKNEKYFANPDKFLPERWLRSNPYREKSHPFAHIPFGYGTRNCVGQRFAEQEIYVSVSKIVKNFKISLPKGQDDVQFVYSTFATPKHKFTLNLKPR
ncbi:probable cytochrome P450 CYP44 [Mizuhopecten yessoensis]|uniref:Cytochrome P450 10 n=1 Tax=Mizuhopecten yessoensis TaxID=6573 RepID=A0A210QQ27_MIZYE|nr:probable cytochrome P450 CYP44 [Mizuhopecten yessoensis]OWF50846.1 Cytochrome P450 10 [Mizuhopecten yessoensis]